VRQAQLNNLRVCGATAASPFVNVTRPSQDTDGVYVCPEGTEACSSFTNSSNTVCVELGTTATTCPITDFQIVVASALVNFNFDTSVTTSPLYTAVDYTSGVSIIFSNQTDSMPITTFQVANGRPCMNPQSQ
jgi:hypothetical protein